jgi:hypothetical protein
VQKVEFFAFPNGFYLKKYAKYIIDQCGYKIFTRESGLAGKDMGARVDQLQDIKQISRHKP